MKKPRRPVDMVVYMYLNVVTEMCYVGSSMYGLEHRHRKHLKIAKTRHCSRFYRALLSWPDELWERVVLERCDSEEALDAAEKKWMSYCGALDNNVGYNSYDARYLRTSVAEGNAMKKRVITAEAHHKLSVAGKMGGLAARTLTPQVKSPARLAREVRQAAWAKMSADERKEQLREWGRKGAAKSRELSAAAPLPQGS